jgi:hypothetical protein
MIYYPTTLDHNEKKVRVTSDSTTPNAVVNGAFSPSAPPAPLAFGLPVPDGFADEPELVFDGVGVVMTAAEYCASSRKTMERLGPGAVNVHPFAEQPVRFWFGVAQLGFWVLLPSVTSGPDQVSPPVVRVSGEY